jgi:arsenate reductase
MTGRVYSVLFLCCVPSCACIMAEVIMNDLGRGKFKGYSAGSHPASAPNPFALETLRRSHLPADGLYSKNWEEFAKPDAPVMDFVVTVCDNAAGEVCPVWPGQPISAHWGVEDPSLVHGSDQAKGREFAKVANILRRRIELFTSLPLEKLDRLKLEKTVRNIGKQ